MRISRTATVGLCAFSDFFKEEFNMKMKRILALLLVIAMAVLMLSACGEKEKPRSITADNLPKGKVLLSSLSNEDLCKGVPAKPY